MKVTMSRNTGVVIVDEGDCGETEDEKNQREIEEFILSNVSLV